MDNKKKGYNLRVLFITLWPAQPKSDAVAPAEIAGLPPGLAAMPDVAVSVVALRPMLPWPGNAYAVAPTTEAHLTHGGHVAMATHIIRWPVWVQRGSPDKHKIWPSAGFAFPFAADRLVNILHAQICDIMIAVDMQFTGYVAYRLREITGVPYVVVQSDSAELTPKPRSSACDARLTAIARDAEFVLGLSANAQAIARRYPGCRFRDFDHGDSRTDKFIELLREAVRQSESPFDW